MPPDEGGEDDVIITREDINFMVEDIATKLMKKKNVKEKEDNPGSSIKSLEDNMKKIQDTMNEMKKDFKDTMKMMSNDIKKLQNHIIWVKNQILIFSSRFYKICRRFNSYSFITIINISIDVIIVHY